MRKEENNHFTNPKEIPARMRSWT